MSSCYPPSCQVCLLCIHSCSLSLTLTKYTTQYHRAGNFRGCKISRICLQTLQKKFSWFLFSWGVPAVPHPSYVRTYTTSRDMRWVKNFVVFIFAVPCRSAKTAKICTPRKFPAIRYQALPLYSRATLKKLGVDWRARLPLCPLSTVICLYKPLEISSL